MGTRKIVQIDEGRCDGCGQCVTACAEGAIQVIDGKARLVRDDYCDGLGACLGDCPQGAIRIVEREAATFDQEAVRRHLASLGRAEATGSGLSRNPAPAASTRHVPEISVAHTCPGSRILSFGNGPAGLQAAGSSPSSTLPMDGDGGGTARGEIDPPHNRSELRQWPIQLHLLPPTAPFLRDADLLLAADCAAFSSGGFHARYLKGHALAIACPKLDDPTGYLEKLAGMINAGGIRSITVLTMQVPCCRGLEQLARMAIQMAGKPLPMRRVVLSLEGEPLVDEGEGSPVESPRS